MWGAKPSTFWKAFTGPRGRPGLKNAPQNFRPDCLQEASLLEGQRSPQKETRIYPEQPPELIVFGLLPVKYQCVHNNRRTRPYTIIGFGPTDGTKSYKSICFGDIDGPKPYEFIGSRARIISHTSVWPSTGAECYSMPIMTGPSRPREDRFQGYGRRVRRHRTSLYPRPAATRFPFARCAG
jgi:hypothetical protein